MKNLHAARVFMEFAFENAAGAEAARAALAPEEKASYPDSRMKVSRRKNVLSLQIEAKDTATLRAAINSSVRWIMVANDVMKGG